MPYINTDWGNCRREVFHRVPPVVPSSATIVSGVFMCEFPRRDEGASAMSMMMWPWLVGATSTTLLEVLKARAKVARGADGTLAKRALYESWLVAGHTGWLGPAAACATATKAITNRITVIVGFGEHMVVVAVDVRGTKESLRASNWNCDCTWWCCGVMQSASAPSAEEMRQKCRRLGALVQLKSKGATKA